jgi:hypothetical protein
MSKADMPEAIAADMAREVRKANQALARWLRVVWSWCYPPSSSPQSNQIRSTEVVSIAQIRLLSNCSRSTKSRRSSVVEASSDATSVAGNADWR